MHLRVDLDGTGGTAACIHVLRSLVGIVGPNASFFRLGRDRSGDMAGPVADRPFGIWQSLFTPSMFRPLAMKYNHFVPVTAVVRRTLSEGIIPVVQHLLKYPFITEIIIDSSQPLSVHDLNLNISAASDVNVQVFSSDEDLGSSPGLRPVRWRRMSTATFRTISGLMSISTLSTPTFYCTRNSSMRMHDRRAT